jgi:hypothetical protein
MMRNRREPLAREREMARQLPCYHATPRSVAKVGRKSSKIAPEPGLLALVRAPLDLTRRLGVRAEHAPASAPRRVWLPRRSAPRRNTARHGRLLARAPVANAGQRYHRAGGETPQARPSGEAARSPATIPPHPPPRGGAASVGQVLLNSPPRPISRQRYIV